VASSFQNNGTILLFDVVVSGYFLQNIGTLLLFSMEGRGLIP
jgi:hypothetical protein